VSAAPSAGSALPFRPQLLVSWQRLRAQARRAWTFLLDRVLRPGRVKVTAALQELSTKVRRRFEDRTVEGDTFDRNRADQWEKFNKGKTSSSYLPKVDD
jgi:hypothetical protein